MELPKLLTDVGFRRQLLGRVKNREVISFWKDRYDRWGREKPGMIESVLNKVTAFTLNPQLRLILGAQDNLLNFKRIMDEEKVLLVDLGRCDGETRRLLGSLIMTGFEQAARSRKYSFNKRRSFYWTVDEFQDFSANDGGNQTLSQILSESRKFGLHLTLAHQSLSQLDDRMKGALGNIQLKVVFGVSRLDAETMATHLFQVNGSRVKHIVPDTVQQGRSHPVYYSLQEEWEKSIQALQNLPARTAFARTPNSQGINRLRTVTIKHLGNDKSMVETIKDKLVRREGLASQQLEKEAQLRTKSSTKRRQKPAPREKARTNLKTLNEQYPCHRGQ